MFHAIRQWWTGGRGKVTARLFLFELVVVILGVLIAQGLANEVQRRGQVAQMQLADQLADTEMRSNYGVALMWRVATPCLRDRLAEIMRRASIGPIPSDFSVRPRIQQMAQTPLSAVDKLLLREIKGSRRADLIDAAQDNMENFSRHTRGLTEGWGRIELADEQYGAVSAEDRLLARTAAADIRAHLRSMNIIGSDIIAAAEKAGLKPDFGPRGGVPAPNCEAIWKAGQIDVPPAPR